MGKGIDYDKPSYVGAVVAIIVIAVIVLLAVWL